MIFELGADRVELETPAQYPLANETQLVQAKDLSASGITHVESFEVETGKITYVFEDMSDNDYVNVMGWFINTANGMMNKFNLTDDLGVTREVRFTSTRIKFDLNSFRLWYGSFTVETEQ
ncbi:MAG: hypothetical protein DRJ03_02635 [Chloroflexi bacterium]|nr:MAG: hypothetical protein DRJ03_02635 [Chloroflexota bacterium]